MLLGGTDSFFKDALLNPTFGPKRFAPRFIFLIEIKDIAATSLISIHNTELLHNKLTQRVGLL